MGSVSMRTVLGSAGAVGALLFGAIGLIALVAIGSSEDADTTAGLIGFVVVFLGLAALGGWMALANFRARPAGFPRSAVEREQRILRLAQAQGGVVSLAQVAEECEMSVAESKQALDRMAVSGAARASVTADGLMVYEFPGLSEAAREGPRVA